MKKTLYSLLLFGLFSICSTSSFAQENTSDLGTEIKLNTLYMILGAAEVNYERVINDESSFGIAGTIVFENDAFWNWGVTPYYRIFFSQGYARGFFVEGHASIFGFEDTSFNFDPFTGTVIERNESGTSGGMGISIGYKVLTSRNLIAEVYGGVGRIFREINFDTVYPRFGINIGKRF